jgi:BirA family biotin operon repressor/biotin-[acetyl-CoA-carboxylase] ligase
LSSFISDRKIKLKYPNDVYVENDENIYKKIAGVLSEHSYSGNKCTESILGIGVNINQTEFDNVISNKATSAKLLGYNLEKERVLQELKNNIDHYVNRAESKVFAEWINELDIVGKAVIVVNKSQKYIVDNIDENGTLNASSNNEKIKINNGDSIIYDLG